MSQHAGGNSDAVFSKTLQVCRIDLHIHTSRYSECAPTQDPLRIPSLLAQKNLDGGVITDHDELWRKEELDELLAEARVEGIVLYRGVEITSAFAHILAFGLEDMRDLPKGVDHARLVAVAREQGAALVWAHPYLNYRGTRSPDTCPEFHAGIHGVEITSSVIGKADTGRTRRLAKKSHWCETGGSDAHTPENVGKRFTTFPFLPANEKELARAILEKKCWVEI